MNVACPQCLKPIPSVDVNIGSDVVFCRGCGQVFSFSELVDEVSFMSLDLAHPPKGAWFHRDVNGFEVGTTTRSNRAFFLVPFVCCWSGLSLGTIYGRQIVKGQFNLWMSLFGIPFFIGTLLVGRVALMAMCGKVVVRVRGNDGVVFTGVGPIGLRRRFKWDGVDGWLIAPKVKEGSRPATITVESYANDAKPDRLDFMIAVLCEMRRKYK